MDQENKNNINYRRIIAMAMVLRMVLHSTHPGGVFVLFLVGH